MVYEDKEEVIIGAYLMAMDVVFCAQFLYLRMCKQTEGCFIVPSCTISCGCGMWRRNKQQQNGDTLCFITPWILTLVWGHSYYTGRAISKGTFVHRSRILLSKEKLLTSQMKLGYSLGALSAAFYITGALTWVYRVYQERRFSGLHCIYIGQTLLANSSYIASILIYSIRGDFLLQSLPWTLARLGLIGIDIGILIQVCINRRKQRRKMRLDHNVVSVLRNEDEFEREKLIDFGDQDEEWLPMKPPGNNRYIQKINQLATQLENEEYLNFNPAFIKDNDSLSSEDLVDVALLRRSSPPKRTLKKSPSRDSKHSFNHSSSTSTVTPMHSDAEWDFEWKDDDIKQIDLTMDEVTKLLEEEDRLRDAELGIKHNKNKEEKLSNTKDTVLWFDDDDFDDTLSLSSSIR